jgi:hypothetical protein
VAKLDKAEKHNSPEWHDEHHTVGTENTAIVATEVQNADPIRMRVRDMAQRSSIALSFAMPYFAQHSFQTGEAHVSMACRGSSEQNSRRC